MVGAVDRASEAEQLALICAHPELAGKEAADGTLTAASTGEQRVPGSTSAAPKNSRACAGSMSTTASASAFPS